MNIVRSALNILYACIPTTGDGPDAFIPVGSIGHSIF